MAEGLSGETLEYRAGIRRTLASYLEPTMPDEIKVPTDFSTLSDADLADLETRAFAIGKPISLKFQANPESLSDEETADLETYGGLVTKVRAVRAERVKNATRARANADAFAVDPEPVAEEPKPEDDKAKPEAKPEAKAVVAGAAEHGAGLQGPADDETAQGTGTRMLAAANVQGFPNGHQFANLGELAVALDKTMGTLPKGPNQFARVPVMVMQRHYAPELTIDAAKSTDGESIMKVLDHAADQGREGVALTAAAGWCAPSQIDYGLLEIETADGMLDLPEVQINRGGIQFTTGPDFSAIFAGAGYWHQTEAQVIAATSKPCMVIPCPSFTEKRLEVEGVCITGAFLQDRGYPEMVARFTRGAMVAHAHKMNIFKINQVVAGSTLFDYTNVANLPVTTTESKDLTVLSRLLAVAGIQVMDLQYKYRMGRGTSLEGVLPYWVVEQVRADIQRRTALEPAVAFSIAEEQIRSWFAIRGVRIQFVYDWLDTYNTTNTSTVGQTAGVYTLPTTVEMLLYPAGTFVAGVSDVVRLDTVYDSTNLALNQYTQLFTEEGILVAKRGYESRRLKVTIDPSGTTSATTDMRTG
jgi:hypothetical protein